MKRNKLFWILPVLAIIILTSACTSEVEKNDIKINNDKLKEKEENIFKDFICGDPVEFTYRGETVIYGSVIGQNNTCWLDRNLGASQVCTSSIDEKCYGDLFQWGRGDDGHQDRNSKTTSDLSLTDKPGHSNFIANHFSISPWDWRLPQNNNLWQGVEGINNPCPPAWRVPTGAELKDEMDNWIGDDNLGSFSSSLKWPAAGYRLNFGKIHPDVLGYVWSSTISSSLSQYFIFSPVGGVGVAHFHRVNGLSVRCILD